jgi:hypothetical protein
LLGLPAKNKKKGYNKKKSSKEHQEALNEANEQKNAMELEFEAAQNEDSDDDEESEEEDPASLQQGSTKKQDVENMRKVQNYIFDFFTQFLHHEVADNILPTLKTHLSTIESLQSVRSASQEDAMDIEGDNLFEQMLKRLDKSVERSNLKML